MPRLLQLLKDHNPATLKIIADYWGIVDSEFSPELVAKEILNNLNTENSRKEFFDALSADIFSAWEYLLSHGGKDSWAKFSRQFGDIRPMGASRIEREQPQLHPDNPAESLWYRGLLGRMFLDQKPEPQEVAYIPDDIFFDDSLKQNVQNPSMDFFDEKDVIKFPNQSVDTLNDLTTILAAARNNEEIQVRDFLFHQENYDWLIKILYESGMLTRSGEIVSSRVKSWFDQKPCEMIASIVDSWYSSAEFNELRLIPELKCEGSWKNDPKSARIFIWNTLKAYTESKWTPVKTLVDSIYKTNPDFQRPAGNYDLWLIRDVKSNEFLRGFDSWDLIEKRLLLFVLTKIMPALGLVDVGSETKTNGMVFQWTSWGRQYLRGIVEDIHLKIPRNTIRSQGSIRLDSNSAFPLRYQLSRFCEWISLHEGIYEFRISLTRLMSAKKSGMQMKHFYSILSQLFAKTVPPTLIKALANLDQNGCLVTAKKMSILSVKNDQVMEEIKKSQASRFLGEQLNSTTIIIKFGMEKDLEKSILELGYFSDFHLEV